MRSLFVTVALAAMLMPAASANPFGTRDIHTCASKTAPTSGAITPDLAAQYFVCDRESVTASQIVLLENVKVQVGAGRHWQSSDDYSEIDMDKPIYPIRGSFRSYICVDQAANSMEGNKTCSYNDQPEASGACYQTTFGDWHCNMLDFKHNDVVSDVPPPR